MQTPNLLRLSLSLFVVFFYTSIFGQLEFKIQLMPDSASWGIYVRPDATITPSGNTITGSGQVTIVAPHGYFIPPFSVMNVSGQWQPNVAFYEFKI